MYQIDLSFTDFIDKIVKSINDYKEMISDVNWIEVATVVIAGICIVLGVLIVLIAVFSGFGKLVSKLEAFSKKMAAKRAARKAAKKAAKQSETILAEDKAPVVKAAPAVKAASQPVVEQGISTEVVAAITAAITASEGSNQFVIRSVKRKDVGSRNPWARAAVNDNTRSF